MDYRETLNYSQDLRRRLVGELVKDKIPTDKEQAELMLKALKDMDQTAINDRKNSIDEQANDTSREVVDAMREFVSLQHNGNPFQRQPDGSAPVTPKVDTERLGDHTLVDGEEEIGVIAETSGDFMKRMEAGKDEEDEFDG